LALSGSGVQDEGQNLVNNRVILFFQNGGNMNLTLRYEGPGIAK